MCCAKGLFGSPSLIYSQCRFAPCFNISLFPPTQITLVACCLLKQTSAFTYLLWACWPLVHMKSPSPSSLGARFIHCVNKSASLDAGIPCSIAMTISITNAWYQGKVCWYPHAIKLVHHTEKYSISNKAINMHSRGPTE